MCWSFSAPARFRSRGHDLIRLSRAVFVLVLSLPLLLSLFHHRFGPFAPLLPYVSIMLHNRFDISYENTSRSRQFRDGTLTLKML